MKYISILIVLIAMFVKVSFAHKVSTFAYREGNQIIGEAYFADGSPCINCRVEAYDERETKISDTVTNEKGKYKFVTEYKGPIKIKVIAGEGHLAEFNLEGLKDTSNTEKQNVTRSKNTTSSKSEVQSSKNVQEISNLNKEEVKKAVNEAIRETIKPEIEGIKNLLIEMKKDMEKVKLRDIIGGIGYIFGIWGIILMLKYRK